MSPRLLLAGLLIAQLADAATFTIGVQLHGIELESNSFAVLLFNLAGLPGVLLAKGAVILITLGVLVATADRFPRVLVMGSAVATSFGLLGVIANSASLILLATA